MWQLWWSSWHWTSSEEQRCQCCCTYYVATLVRDAVPLDTREGRATTKNWTTNTCKVTKHPLALKGKTSKPNQQHTLNKVPTELRCRNFCQQAPTEHANRCQTCEKRACNVYTFQLSLHFAHHCCRLGSQSEVPAPKGCITKMLHPWTHTHTHPQKKKKKEILER